MPNVLTRDHLLSLVGAPVIWGAHFLLCYVAVSLACAYGVTQPRLFGRGPTELGIGSVTVVALGLLAWIFIANYRKLQYLRCADAVNRDVSAFFAFNSMMLSGLSAIALIWVAFPAWMLPPCAA